MIKMIKVPCRVCNKLYDGTTHCSVSVCRACAMFFRRCETWDSIPVCRLGNNNWKLKDMGKIQCSACRYQRCVLVGLKRRENARSLKMAKKKTEQHSMADKEQFILNIDLSMLVAETMPTLKMFCYNYALQANARKVYELGLLREEGEELLELPGNRKMALMKHCRSSKLAINSYPEFVKFINSSFPVLEELDPITQELIVMLLMFYFFDLFCSFQTWRTFKDINTTRIVCSEVMFADFNHLNSYIGLDVPLDPMDLKVIANYLSISWRPHLTEKLRLLHRINITDVEYLAASALVIWDADIFEQFPQLQNVANKHRNLIYKDLDYYYRHILHLNNYVERIMNIKELIKGSKKTLHSMSDTVNFLRTFNYYKDNEEMWEKTQRLVNVLKSPS